MVISVFKKGQKITNSIKKFAYERKNMQTKKGKVFHC